MFNNSFLKKLNILFIESNTEDREHFSNILYKFFNNVVVCSNGKEGIDSFLEKRQEYFVDIIICDKTLEDITGIEVLKKIREIDSEIPFIITSPKIEVDDLLIAIKYKATDYLSKPVNGKDMIFCIERVCHNKYHERLKLLMQQDLEELRAVINEVALVSKTDLEGNITFVNSYFTEITGYSQDEIIGQNRLILKDENTSISLYKDLLEKVKAGIVWEGKLKNISKTKEEYYVYLTVLPIYDKKNSNIIEFMWISFLTTEAELEEKEFKKRVVKNMYENRRINTESRQKIDELMNQISGYSNIKTLLNEEKKRKAKFTNQINFYENELKVMEEKIKEISEKASQKIKQVVSAEKEVREKKDKAIFLLNDVTIELEDKNKKVKKLTKELSTQMNLIKKLMISISEIEESIESIVK
ncbi:MAG: response regulator [Aliarcobacter sp.]|jgi:PAS domain S-box-containing protein|nr:response regulator [Aliarcobacter sp.]